MPFIASAVVASLLAALAARAMPMLESRAPHFAEIIQPSEPLIVRNSTGGNTTFLLTYRNGERADGTTANVALVNDTGSYTVAEGLQFIDNWYTVNQTISLPADLADGDYSLSVEEVYETNVESQTMVSITFSRNANATVPTSSPSASSQTSPTASAYLGNAPETPAGTVAANTQPETSSIGRLASALAALTQA